LNELDFDILIPGPDLSSRVTELGSEISAVYRGGMEPPVLVCVLKGSVLFLADLVRSMDIDVSVDFMSISSYSDTGESSGVVRIVKDLETDLTDRDVIIVEDIVDTGLTLKYMQEILHARGPKSLKTACLLSKPSRRKVQVPVEYIGFTIEDKFVVGYGLDYAEQYRNLPYIGVLKPPNGVVPE
jgi:hypoxanthine phosphoribosyltransferase